jgi:hypothetical protein
MHIHRDVCWYRSDRGRFLAGQISAAASLRILQFQFQLQFVSICEAVRRRVSRMHAPAGRSAGLQRPRTPNPGANGGRWIFSYFVTSPPSSTEEFIIQQGCKPASIVETPTPSRQSMVDLKLHHQQNLQARNKPIAGLSPSTKLLPWAFLIFHFPANFSFGKNRQRRANVALLAGKPFRFFHLSRHPRE